VNESLLDIHDGLLLRTPEGARHEASLCAFCTDWAMSESGIPSGFDRLDLADAKAPYGDVDYADPGILEDGVKRFPIDTVAHAQAAWTFIHEASVAEMYSADDLAEVRQKISKALEQFGTEAKDDEVEHTKNLAEAKNAGKPVPGQRPASSTPKKKSTTDAASEGGTTHMEPDETISKETHEALLDKAVRDATALLTVERDNLKAQVDTFTTDKASIDTELAAVKSENERLNGELDTAQVSLKAAQDEAAALKADIASRDEQAEKATIASDRAAQVRNLGLFTEEYITDKASKWAEQDDESWSDRLDEWKALKGQTTTTTTTTTDTASALTGTREGGTGHESSARRAILGLV
jgi:hypothetical protein